MSRQFIWETFSGELNLGENSNPKFYKIPFLESLRFFVIQILIATLQLLDRTESLVVFLANLVYFIYFFYTILSAKVYNSRMTAFKAVVQELSLMVFITTIVVFSFSEGKSFQSSTVYRILETVAVIAIIGACGAEFLLLVTEVFSGLSQKICRKNLKKKSKLLRGKEVVADPFGSPEKVPRNQVGSSRDDLGEERDMQKSKIDKLEERKTSQRSSLSVHSQIRRRLKNKKKAKSKYSALKKQITPNKKKKKDSL